MEKIDKKNNNKKNVSKESSYNLLENKVISYLQRNEEINEEIYRSVAYIKRYYFWRAIFNSVKIAIVVIVIVLGIVSWESIVSYFSNPSGGIEQQITNTVKDEAVEKLNISNN